MTMSGWDDDKKVRQGRRQEDDGVGLCRFVLVRARASTSGLLVAAESATHCIEGSIRSAAALAARRCA
jgi:hypothetical protein